MVLPVVLAPAAAACCGACVNDIMKQPFPVGDEEETTNEGEYHINQVVGDEAKETTRNKPSMMMNMISNNEPSKTEFRKSEALIIHEDNYGVTTTNSVSSFRSSRSASSKGQEPFAPPQAIVSQAGDVEMAQNYLNVSFEQGNDSSALPDATISHSSSCLGKPYNSPTVVSPIVNHWGYVDGKFSEGRIYNLVTKHEAQCVAFSPCTMLIAVGMESANGFGVYETKRFQLLNQVSTSHTVVSVQWKSTRNQSTANILAVAGRDGTISIFEVDYRQPRPSIHKPQGVLNEVYITRLSNVILGGGARCMVFLPQQRLGSSLDLVVGEKTGSITMISKIANSLEASKRMNPIARTLARYRGCLKCITVSRDGCLLASGDEFGAVRILQLSSNQSKKSLLDESNSNVDKGCDVYPSVSICMAEGDPVVVREGKIRTLIFSKNDEILFVGGHDNYVAMIDTKIWKVLREIKFDGAVNALAFNDNFRYLAVGSRDKKLQIFDTSTYHAVKEIQTTGWVTSLSWGSGQHQHACLLAAKTGNHQISIFNIQNNQIIKDGLHSSGKGCCVSFSPDGKYIARVSDKSIIVSSELHSFQDIAKVDRSDTVYSVKWGVQDKKYFIATVGDDGYLAVYLLCSSAGVFYLELVTEIFLSPYLRDLSWSIQGGMIACGGREKKVHFVSVTPGGFEERHKPVLLKGMIYSIDFAPDCVQGIRQCGLAVGTDDNGDGVVTLFDIDKCEKVLEITRPRTVRCVRYHPLNPLLAIADSGNTIIYVDLLAEQVAKEFRCFSRVSGIEFSLCGKVLALADDLGFTIREVSTFNILQEIETRGRDKSLAFSGNKGLYLALDDHNHALSIMLLGPLLNCQYIPIIQDFEDMPPWVLAEIYTSPDGPSILQRFMIDGGERSILKTVEIVKRHPEAFLTFNRKTGENCFNTAFTSGNTSLIAFAMTLLVNGSLEVKSCCRSILMTGIPAHAIALLQDMVSYMPPQFIVDIICKLNFVKVPFSHPRVVPTLNLQECASPSFFDPWKPCTHLLESQNRLDKEVSRHRIDLKHEHLLNPAVLPLPGLGSYHFLKTLTVECPPSVFDNDAMELVLRIMWKQHIKSFFLIDFFIFVIFFCLWIFFAELSTSSSLQNQTLMHSIGGTLLVLNLLFTLKELVQSNMCREPDYFRSMWNLSDVLALACVYTYIGVTFFSSSSTSEEILLWVAVFGTFFLTLKFLSYLRGFPFTGWLISVLRQNFLDVQGFAVVMLVILVGFTVAFRLVLEGNCNSGTQQNCTPSFTQPIVAFFATLQLSLLSVYDPVIFQGNDNKLLLLLIFFLAVTIVTVVSLNALISILGDSYSRVQEHATANQRMERAQLIVEYLSLIPKRKREDIEQRTRYFHALLKSDSHGDLLVNHEDPGMHALRALRRDIGELSEQSNERTKLLIDQMRNSVDSDISSLRSEVLQALHMLSMDVKRLQRTREAAYNPAAGAIALGNRGVMTAVSAVTNYGMKGGIFAPRNETDGKAT